MKEFKFKVLVLTTDTLHHKYLIQQLNLINFIDLAILYIHKKSFKFIPKNNFEKKEFDFEKKFFFKNKNYDVPNKIYYIEDINSKKCVDLIKDIKPDIGILFGTKKVTKTIIQVFQKNLINIHRGIMQKYRGLDSEYWALYEKNFKFIGTTIHYVNEFLDKGKIIFEKKIQIKKNTKCFHLRYHTTKIASEGINYLFQNLNKKKKIKTYKKQTSGKYYSSISEVNKKIACKNLVEYCKKI